MSPDEPSGEPGDAALVRRVLEGDREAYSALVTRHQDDLFRYARSMDIDADTARDLVQDAFVKGYTSLASCRDPEHFGTWVFRILRNRCLDWLKNVRRRRVPLDDVVLPDGREGPDGEVALEELGDRLRRALDGLTPDLRDAFLLKHLEERSYDEMAELAGASVSAMKMRVHRAREALRNGLRDDAVREWM